MKYRLYYFTGTGNTARAVGIIQSSLEQAGHQLHTELITPHTAPPDPGSYDVLLLSFPTYAWAPPVLVQKYIRRLKGGQAAGTRFRSRQGSRTKAAVCVIDGGGSFQCADQSRRMLQRRGFDVVLTSRAGYADNWRQMTNPPSQESGRKENPTGDAQVREFVRQLLQEDRAHYHVGLGHTLWSRAVAWLFKWIGRPLMATFYTSDNDCTSCNLCAEACPVGAIRMKPAVRTAAGAHARTNSGKKLLQRKVPRWQLSCESCNRCINICPVSAINTSITRIGMAIVLASGSIWVLFFSWDALLSGLSSGATGFPGSGLLFTLVKIGLVIGGQWIGAALMGLVTPWAEKIPPLRRLMLTCFNKRFNHYTAEGFKARQHV
ncbi:MAG: EFR1 family ferrodoxin [Spirochaetia bacterium]